MKSKKETLLFLQLVWFREPAHSPDRFIPYPSPGVKPAVHQADFDQVRAAHQIPAPRRGPFQARAQSPFTAQFGRRLIEKLGHLDLSLRTIGLG
ncbi:hypothetical protein V6N11_055937 [Hibiscus sabdariffa]|uniref:Uncharacterized protein n=1 Tax=Hibiscus sabdariffa TaxID=183260 RepID=A0ABR2T369_9ROSI